jgi:hypothetical protein
MKIVPLSGRVIRGAREETADSLFLGIVVAGRAVNVAVDAFRDVGGPFTGFDLIDGKRVMSAALHKGPLLNLGREADIAIQVRRDSVVCEIDKKQIFAWQGDPVRLETSSQWLLRDSRYLGIGAHQTSYKIREFRLTPIDDAPLPTDLKPGEWTVRLRDGSLVVGRPIAKQTLTLHDAEGSEPQLFPVDALISLRMKPNGKSVEVELSDSKPWTAAVGGDNKLAALRIQSRWGEVTLPLSTIREASLFRETKAAVTPLADPAE